MTTQAMFESKLQLLAARDDDHAASAKKKQFLVRALPSPRFRIRSMAAAPASCLPRSRDTLQAHTLLFHMLRGVLRPRYKTS